MKRIFGILFVLLIALALGTSVGDLRAEGVSMRLAGASLFAVGGLEGADRSCLSGVQNDG